MKKTQMLVACFLLSGAFQSCKKEVAQQNPDPKPAMNRKMADPEEEILDDLKDFYEYAKDPDGDNRGSLPEYLTPARANAVIENVFNYYFARLDYTLAQDAATVVSEEISLKDNGTVSTFDLANTFNRFRSEIKEFYATQYNLDKSSKFVLADAEFSIREGKAVFSVKALIGKGVGPEPKDDAYPPFDNSDKWSIYNAGGRDDSFAKGQWGAPEILTMAISQDIYPGANPLKVNVVDLVTNSYLGWVPATTPNDLNAPDNPLYTLDATQWGNSLMHLVSLPNPALPPTSPPYYNHIDAEWITPTAMNYYRTWIKALVLYQCTQNNKSLVRMKIIQSPIPSGGTPNPLHYYHVLHAFSEFYAGDEMTSIPVSGDPDDL